MLANILDAARARPVVIQTLWTRVRGELPPDSAGALHTIGHIDWIPYG